MINVNFIEKNNLVRSVARKFSFSSVLMHTIP